MKRILLLTFVLAAALVLPSSASARIIELGGTADPAALNCPGTTENPCVAAVRMTGYQGRATGGPKNPYYIRRDGFLVAFTVQLAKPTAEEIKYFQDNFGTPSTARISVLRRGTNRKTRLDHRLVNQSERFGLDSYFGSKPTFAFDKPIPVKKGNWIALTVPTWAPLLALGPAAHGLVALLAAQGQLRAAREPAPVRARGSARRRQVRLHVPQRPASVQRHVHTEQPRDEQARQLENSPSTHRSSAVASTR